MWRRVWISLLIGAAAAVGWREYAVRWGDWTFRSPERGAAMLMRTRGDEGMTWSLIFDDWKDYPIQVAASHADLRARGQEMWRDSSTLRLCVPSPKAGVRISAVGVTTDIGRREIVIDQQGCDHGSQR
jgi:hypothetical protein